MTSFANRLTRYYQISFVLVIAAILGTVIYFWKLGFIDGSKGQGLHKVSYILEQYDQKKPIDEISEAVWSENPKMAIGKLESLESDLEKVYNTVNIGSFKQIAQQIQETKKNASGLISYPKIVKIISVFNDKMTKFNLYVDEKNWKTLTRMSDRVIRQSKGHIGRESIGKFAQNVENEFSEMEKITETSVLDRPEKLEIINRLNNLKVETGMLRKYETQRDIFDKSLASLQNGVGEWLKTVNPEVAIQKLQVEQIGRYYIVGLLGILILTSLIFFGSFLHNRLSIRKMQIGFEKKIKNFITENILGQSEEGLEEVSEEFRNFTLQSSNYINKRMNFGSVFQEALPFSSVLLDSNLKVIWANKHFTEQWDINETDISKDHLSWDYLVKMTNIGENDPVLEALKNNIAGIYQVKIKCQNESEVRPFEMYVSPVTFNQRTRIMVFFYSLVSLQDTIQDQAQSIVEPIRKSIELLISENYEDLSKNNFGKEFEIGKIEFIQEKFLELRDTIIARETMMLDEIEYLQARCDKLDQTLEDINNDNKESLKSTKQQVGNLKLVKDSVIHLSEVGKTFEHLNVKSNQLLDDVFKNLDIMSKDNSELTSLLDQMSGAFPKFDLIKDEFKSFKNDVTDSKSKLSHGLAQFVHLKKRIVDPLVLERFSKTYERVMEEFKTLEMATSALDKKLTSLEVMFSKSKMVVGSLEEQISGRIGSGNTNKVDELFCYYQSLRNEIIKIQGSTEQAEDEVVGQMAELYQNTKLNFRYVGRVSEMLGQQLRVVGSNLNTSSESDHDEDDVGKPRLLT